ncbi:Incenp-like protein ICP-1 [Aphelenchoides fujianensis]|nr:Incenp-like protein ICP-1 [Aphelenchoides fujianensis]
MPPRRNPKKAKDANAPAAPPSIVDVWGKFFTIPPVDVFQEPVNEWALETLQQIREYRDELKEQLEECVAKKMKKTPKKLAFKMPAIPKPSGRRIDFGADEEVGTAPQPTAPAAPTPPVAPAPPAATTPRSAPRTVPRTPAIAEKSVDETMRPFHTSKRVIPATPSPRHLQASSPAVYRPPLMAPSMGTASTPTARPMLTPVAASSNLLSLQLPPCFQSAGRTFTTKPREAKSPARNADRLEAKRKAEEERRLMLEEAQRKQQEAERRRQEYLQHEKERHARENNQRKQRVVLRNKAKQQQDEQQREEKKRQEDRIRKFHEAQRTPNKQTPTKLLHAAHPPATPRQKAVPIKRSKPSHDEPMPEVEHQYVEEVEDMQVDEINPPSSIHPPSPPAAGPSREPPAVELELEVVQTVVTVVQEFESAMNISGPIDQPLTQGYSVAEADNEETRVEQPPTEEADRTKVVAHPRVPPTRLEESKDDETEDSTAMEAEAVEQSTQRSKEATPNETAAKPPPAESVVLEESPFDEEDEKENAQAAVPETPVAAPRNKPNESVYEMTPDKIYLPSTEHDYNVRDLTSGDETDDEENPRKRVPKWAEKNCLGLHVRDLLRRIDDPSVYFGQIKPPKMDVLFPATVQKYQELPNETTVWDSPIWQPRRASLKK